MNTVARFCFLVLAVCVFSNQTHAANHTNSEKSVYIVAHSSADTSKHWVVVTGLTKTDGSAHACSTNGLYFDAADKEIAAVLINSQMNGFPVDLAYADGAPLVAFTGTAGGGIDCRLIAAWID
jgi:hypothetical protein